MSRLAMIVLLVSVATSAAPWQQPAETSVVADLRDREYKRIQRVTVQAAEIMPEERYAFRPTPGLRTFGQAIAHVAMTNSRLCRGLVEGVIDTDPKYANLEAETQKAVLLQALRETFAYCDQALERLNDENSRTVITAPSGQSGPRGGLLSTVVSHTNAEHGKLTIYLRLNGLIPPSSQLRR